MRLLLLSLLLLLLLLLLMLLAHLAMAHRYIRTRSRNREVVNHLPANPRVVIIWQRGQPKSIDGDFFRP
jgi:methionine-rich copper-binding protein CopC